MVQGGGGVKRADRFVEGFRVHEGGMEGRIRLKHSATMQDCCFRVHEGGMEGRIPCPTCGRDYVFRCFLFLFFL